MLVKKTFLFCKLGVSATPFGLAPYTSSRLTVRPRVPRHKGTILVLCVNPISKQVGACIAGPPRRVHYFIVLLCIGERACSASPYRILIKLNAVHLRMAAMR